MITHELKTEQPFFDAVACGDKPFEIRRNDRGGFMRGDVLWLREWTGTAYTERAVRAQVTYVTDFAQQPGYVVMGVRLLSEEEVA